MKKNNKVKITKITACNYGLFGLGSDGKIYEWISEKADWFLYKYS